VVARRGFGSAFSISEVANKESRTLAEISDIHTGLTQSRLKEILHYEPRTGIFTWLSVLCNRVKAGDRAGSLHANGYMYIGVDNKSYRAHRLAWFYQTGEWPTDDIDHIDMCRDNNCWSNLREATRSQNLANSTAQRNNRLGIKGVCRHQGRYRSYISKGRKKIHLGMFDTPEDAHAAYCEAAERLHGAFARAA